MIENPEPIPPTQLFRVLLTRLLETQQALRLYIRDTTQVSIKTCYQTNLYTLSEIEAWAANQREGLEISLSYSPAQYAEMQAGVGVVLSEAASPDHGVPSTQLAKTAPVSRVRGILAAQSLPPTRPTPRVLERNSAGQIVFRQK